MATVADLGKKFKEKNPDYAWADDAELGRKLKAKYPGGYDDFTEVTAKPEDLVKNLPGPATINPKDVIRPVNTATGRVMNPQEEEFIGKAQKQLDANESSQAFPGVGAMIGGTPGAAIGALLKQAVQKKDPTPYSAAQDVTTDTVLQSIAPLLARGGGAIVRAFTKGAANLSPSIQNAVNEEANAKNYADTTIRNIMNENRVRGGNLAREDVANKANELAKQEYEGATYDRKANIDYFTQKTRGRIANEDDILTNIASKIPPHNTGLPGTIKGDLYEASQGRIPYSKVADRMFSNTKDLEQMQLIDPQGVEKVALSRIVSSGFKGKKLDPERVLLELDRGTYKKAISSEAHSDLSDLMISLKDESEKVIPKPTKILPAGEPLKYTPEKFEPQKTDNVLSLSKGGIMLGVPAAMAHLTGHPIGGALSGVVLGEAAINLMTRNPQLTKIAIQLSKMPIDSPASSMLTQALLGGLRGASVLIPSSDGEYVKAIIGPDGKPQLPRPK